MSVRQVAASAVLLICHSTVATSAKCSRGIVMLSELAAYKLLWLLEFTTVLAALTSLLFWQTRNEQRARLKLILTLGAFIASGFLSAAYHQGFKAVIWFIAMAVFAMLISRTLLTQKKDP